jgi:ATP-binding cassette subfamily B protein
MALVGRLIDPDEGEVLLDGVPLRDLSRPALRTAVAYGFERPELIGESIADVIAFGERRPTKREIAAAARAARADGFLRHLHQGYETRLDEAPLSGGEAQRLGLARAFAHGTRVLVLDDVTSRLDTATEHHIASVLTSARFTQTRLVVAHRVSTAARSDLVVWLDHGRLSSVGRHSDLWAHPAYRRLFEPDRSFESSNGRRASSANGSAI